LSADESCSSQLSFLRVSVVSHSEIIRTAPEQAWPAPAYAWYVVVMLTLAYGFAILDRVAISLLVGPIKADLHISDTEIGLLQGLAFAICYTSFGIVLGYLVDRWRRGRLLALGVLAWSAATICCGMANSFATLFAGRIGVGVGEASVTPASSSLIADYFPPDGRAKAYSIFLLGSSVGSGLSYLVGGLAIVTAAWLHANGVGWIAALHTWQITFFLVGLPGIAIAALVFATIREPVRRGRLSTENPEWNAALKFVASKWPAYTTLVGGVVLNVTAVYAAIAWNATLFVRVHGWAPAKVATVFGLYNVPLGVLGAVLAGWAMAALQRRGRSDAPLMIVLAHALATALSGTAMALTQNPVVALGLYAPYCLSSTWSYSAALTGLNQITPNQLRGQVTALYTVATGLISLSIGSASVGLLSDRVFQSQGGLSPSLACVFAASGAASVIVLAAGWRAYRAIADRSNRQAFDITG
jgi:MFS family permease